MVELVMTLSRERASLEVAAPQRHTDRLRPLMKKAYKVSSRDAIKVEAGNRPRRAAMAHLDTVIRHLRRTVDHEDAHLLTMFIEQQDQEAFASLVKRHGPLVWGVCRRMLTHHIAEDAVQATFFVLARKARSVRPREMVANWLHGVAYRTALQARNAYLKQQMREKQVAKLPEPEAALQEYSDLRAVIDQELIGLPERYRLAIILCDLEDTPIKEAARQLGWPQGTLAGRLFRARKLLATRLARRGLVVSAGSLTGLAASASMPATLVGATVTATSLQVVPAKIAALMEGVMTAMLVTKLKTVAVVLVVLTAVGFGGGWLSRSTPASAQTAGVLGGTKALAMDYKSFFGKTLAVMGEHFEQITHANQYEGRIEACTVQPDANGVVRQADVRFTCVDGGFAVDVRVSRIKRTGDESTIVGRDAALEREIHAKLKERNTQQEMPSLKGEWRVVSITGGEKAFDVFKQTDLVFLGERMLAVPNDPNDTGPTTVYRVHLGAKRPVQEIDFYRRAADDTRLLGVYELRKDELRLCLSNRRGTRPTNVESTRTQALIVARRMDDTSTSGRKTVEHKASGPTSLAIDFGFPVRFVDSGTVSRTEPLAGVVTEVSEGDRVRFTVPRFALLPGDELHVAGRTPQAQYVGVIKVLKVDGKMATAAAVTLKREICKGDLVARLNPTEKELASNVPLFFTIATAGKKDLWLRVDDRHWIERNPEGSENKYQIIARTKVRGNQGILTSMMPSDAKQVFIPDKRTSDEVLLRRIDQLDAGWQTLGVMKNVE